MKHLLNSNTYDNSKQAPERRYTAYGEPVRYADYSFESHARREDGHAQVEDRSHQVGTRRKESHHSGLETHIQVLPTEPDISTTKPRTKEIFTKAEQFLYSLRL